MPLAEVNNDRIFSLKRDIVGSHATCISTELLHVSVRIKAHADPTEHNSVNQEQISFVRIAFMFLGRQRSKESQRLFSVRLSWFS
jgi:hypothetical protein